MKFSSSVAFSVVMVLCYLQIFLFGIALVVDYHLALWYMLAFLGRPWVLLLLAPIKKDSLLVYLESQVTLRPIFVGYLFFCHYHVNGLSYSHGFLSIFHLC